MCIEASAFTRFFYSFALLYAGSVSCVLCFILLYQLSFCSLKICVLSLCVCVCVCLYVRVLWLSRSGSVGMRVCE